ncbi:ABC transporter ATP-binding protein [Halobaculum gomorrense]|uniref:Molybdate/tungstate import ATP-binding protein WtpC n=1 Tax=Halobaculum gomorrense TaxID=43928 RepID=A0A1M5LY90_9EURY|nr:ATP-binding cassette domain-containing protein [Halobaculum gomorrense]SHG69363.1 ABC-type Fe3+/spermidine/putrescine transport systems, ATPase components [Halobaculum gomorrense]
MGLSADVTATFTADGADAFVVDATVEVERGESLVVLGPSGSGKTLLLETVAGFHDHEGVVSLDGEALNGLDPEDRGFGFVFQDYALFPHLTVTENAAYGTRYRDDHRDPDDLLAELGVADLCDRYPPTLSGGEKQRVALARALAVRPKVMLLDEPLAALDVPTRQALRDDLAAVLDDVTAVYVTHNRTTARAVADRIAVMRDGQIVQTGTPEAVFERPASPMVAAFTGSNVIAADALRGVVDVPADAMTAAVRPEHVALVDGTGDGGDLTGEVARSVREDAAHRITVDLDADDPRAELSTGAVADGGDARLSLFVADDPPAPGERVGVSVPPERVTLFAAAE